jgi:hypothetical protein
MADLRDFFDFMAAEMPRMLADWRSRRKDRTPGR